MDLNKEEYYACEKCGQVYHSPINKCIKLSISLLGKTTQCNSTKIIKIKKEDVVNIHDVWDNFMSILAKLFGVE